MSPFSLLLVLSFTGLTATMVHGASLRQTPRFLRQTRHRIPKEIA